MPLLYTEEFLGQLHNLLWDAVLQDNIQLLLDVKVFSQLKTKILKILVAVVLFLLKSFVLYGMIPIPYLILNTLLCFCHFAKSL